MNRAEQLADYLAGTLTPEEQAALTAELARDTDLRAQLDAIRSADQALGQLSSPTPPAGFEERLDAALADELATHLGNGEVAAHARRDGPARMAADAGDLHGGGDELATRRARRTGAGTGWPRWVTAVSGAAAALIVLAGAGVVFSGILGGDDSMVTTESMDTADDAGGAESAEDEAAMQAAPADGPLLRTTDRDLDEDAAQAMLGDAEAFAVADRNLDAAGARDLAATYAQALGAGAPAAADGSAPDAGADDAAPEADADASAGDDAEDATDGSTEEDAGDAAGAPQTEALDDPATGGAPLRMDPDISPDQRAQVGRCLTELLDAETEIVPVYAELTSFNAAPVILFGFVTEDPETGRFTRREVWIVDRDSCQVQLFLQD